MNGIKENEVNEFLREIQPRCKGTLGKIQQECIDEQVPMIPPETAKLLGVILQIKKPKRILEIGTAVGFSACFMSQYLPKDGEITTIERFDVMSKQAKINIARMGLEDKITMLEGDAAEILPKLDGPYDLVFIDAAKGQYNVFLKECIRLLPIGGIVLADNVLQGEFIVKSRYEIPRRQRTIHKRMRNFLWYISHSRVFDSSIIPIGDGLAVCYKKAETHGEEGEFLDD